MESLRIVLSLVVVALVVSSGWMRGAAGEPSTAPDARTFAFTYETRFTPPQGAKRLEMWVPLPFEDDLQQVADLDVKATVGGTTASARQHRDALYGNRMAHVGIDDPRGDVVIRWTARITRHADQGQGKGPLLDRYLEADERVPIEGRATKLAHELGVTQGDAAIRDRARTIYDHVLTTMEYDKVVPGWGTGDFERACDVGKGNCTDFHAKFMGIGRAARIPVRFTMGIPITPAPEGKAGGYHCWAHFHDGSRWVPVDISEAQKVHASDPERARWFFGNLDPDRLSLSLGRDLVLAPPQKGPPLPFFAYPYAEVDGKPVPVPSEGRTFTWTSPE